MITHYGFSQEPSTTWTTVAFFEDRYELTMEVKIVVDYHNNIVTPLGSPTFVLSEITSVEGLADLVLHGDQKTFGIAEWEKVYESGGDFASIGFDLRNDSPVPGIEHYIRASRRDRLPVSLIRRSGSQHHKDR
jgi:hypothetical protein